MLSTFQDQLTVGNRDKVRWGVDCNKDNNCSLGDEIFKNEKYDFRMGDGELKFIEDVERKEYDINMEFEAIEKDNSYDF